MSRVPQSLHPGGGGGYTNGSSSQSSSRYGSEDRGGTSVASGGSSRERRAGNYARYYDIANGSPQPQDHQIRPRTAEEGQRSANARLQPNGGDRSWSDRSRSAEGEGNRMNGTRRVGTRQIEDVLQYIQQEWEFMTDDDCIPVQVALQLMDSSSLGRAHQFDQFQQTHKQLQRALRAIVNEHHQGFNSSIGTFHKIQSSIQNSQNRVRALKDSLVHAKSSLSTTNPELKGLAHSSQNYDEMLQLLGYIEQLQLVPEKLEARISEKRFLSAIDVLHEALRIIRRSELEDIGALTELRVYLSNQETSLTDILIEELHNHLYLKSPYCQDRWKSVAQDQPNVLGSDGSKASPVIATEKPIYLFLEKLNTVFPMTDDASRNPEADTFYYIQLLVESLSKMGRLDIAVDSIEQRLPVELFRVVDKTNDEVDRRHPTTMRRELHHARRKVAEDFDHNEVQSKIVYDLLSTLYSKFEAIAEGHRVLHDVIQGILKREGVRNAGSLTGGFKELWKLYQSEMRSLLHDYLATDADVARRSSPGQTNGVGGFQRNQRDKFKKVFKFSDLDNKSAELASEQEDLDFILKSSVPGLVSNSRRSATMVTNNRSNHYDGSATGHKLLIEPSVFNMGLLLPPSLSFIQRLKGIVPPGSDIVISTLTAFLDDFLVNVFHPQLDETLADLSAQTFIELDAFQEDPKWTAVARKPIFKGTSAFFSVIAMFCKMLDTIPQDQAFSQLIITHMETYHEKCFGWYKSLVIRAQSQSQGVMLKAAAAFAESGELHDTMMKLLTAENGERQNLLNKEIGLLILNTNENPLQLPDLISDRKTVISLCLLHTSMEWLATKVNQLRHLTTNEIDSSRYDGRSKQRRRWTLFGPAKPHEEETKIYLPMNQETLVAFDGVITSYQNLALTVLLTLNMEIRCQAIYSLTNSVRSNYLFADPVNDPDPGILTLNADLVTFDEDITTYLRDQEHNFLTVGLSHLLDALLLSLATSTMNTTSPTPQPHGSPTHATANPANKPRIASMNNHGADRMQLNILVLQQNLKNIEHEPPSVSLNRSARFFDLFLEGPDAILAKVKEGGGPSHGNEDDGTIFDFSYDELKALVELCYSEPLASERRDVAMQAKRQLNDRLLVLSEHLWQS